MLPFCFLPKACALTGFLVAGLFVWHLGNDLTQEISPSNSLDSSLIEDGLFQSESSTQNWDISASQRRAQARIMVEKMVNQTVLNYSGLSYVKKARLSQVMKPEQFDTLSDTHRQMLANLAEPDEELPPGTQTGGGDNSGGISGQGIVTRPFVCFAPGTPDEVREPFSALSGQGQVAEATAGGLTALALQTSSRWSRTATNGRSTGSNGDPLTLTWSIVPDELSIPGDNGEPTAPSNLRAWLNSTYGSEATWLPLFQSVFDKWEALTGITYVYEPNDDGASFPGSRGILSQRGDVRIAGHPIDGNFNVLAYNFFPDTGDMVIDTTDSYLTSTTNNSIRLRNTIAHEHGHGLALSHVCPINQTKLMEPNLTTSFDGPQHDDIYSSQSLYGDRFENDDTSATATNLGTLSAGSAEIVKNLSIIGRTDSDYLKFQSPGSGYDTSIILRPVGLSYLEGGQTVTTCTGTTFNSLDKRNLTLQLYNSSGTTLLASSASAGAGAAESINSFGLISSGPFIVKISADNVTATQIYELEISFSPSVTTPEISISDLSVTEEAGTIAVPVSLSAPTTVTVTVSWSTSDISATSGADYQVGSGTVIFSPGDISETIVITCLEDTLDEGDEALQINLSSPQNATIADGQATVTITDNDPLPILSVTPDIPKVSETDPNASFTFSLDTPSGRTVSFAYSTDGASATSGTDFSATSGTLTLPAGTISTSISVPITNDTEAEANESFSVATTSLTNASSGLTSLAEVLILDDDALAQFANSSASFSSPASGTGLQINWDAVPGRTYRIEESTDLTNWTTVPGAENVDPSTSQATFVIPVSIPGERRFYRLVDES
jgi:hypothetical protein